MPKIVVMLALLSGAALLSAMQANAEDCKSGRYKNGHCVDSFDNSNTYAGCVKNGRMMGYSDADTIAYCKRSYSH